MARIIEPPPAKSNSEARWNIGRWLKFAYVAFLVLAGAFAIDAAVDQWVAAHSVQHWEAASKICSRFFSWPWLMAIAAVGLLIAWRRGRRDWVHVLCAMMIAASIAGLSADMLRAVTGRTRPYATVPQGFYGVRAHGKWLVTQHAYNSFPSGHTTTITAFILPLFFRRKRYGLVLFPLVVVVGAARIYLRAHHLTDVITAVVLGSIVASIVWRQATASQWTFSGWRLRRVRA